MCVCALFDGNDSLSRQNAVVINISDTTRMFFLWKNDEIRMRGDYFEMFGRIICSGKPLVETAPVLRSTLAQGSQAVFVGKPISE